METTTENKMGTKPVWSLLLAMAVPVILSTAAQSLYNIVDGIFVSLLAAFTLVRPYLSAQTNSPAILEGGAAYLTVYLGLGIGAILNLILDPVLIFTAGMGITGAALATVIGQTVAMIVALSLNLAKNKEVYIRFTLTPPVYAVKRVLVLGLPSTLLLLSAGSGTQHEYSHHPITWPQLYQHGGGFEPQLCRPHSYGMAAVPHRETECGVVICAGSRYCGGGGWVRIDAAVLQKRH